MTYAEDTADAEPTRAGLCDYLRAVFGDTEGFAHMAEGVGGYFDHAGSYKFPRGRGWVQRHYAWPAEAKQLTDDILGDATDSDVYLCPYLMSGRKRQPDDAVELTKVHADIDGDCRLDKVADLGGWAVGSGSPGHAHVYVDLDGPIPPHQHTALCRALGAYLGDADAKIRPNDVLRPPGTLNHKSRARGEESTAVEWLIRPTGVQWDAGLLADRLGITLPTGPPDTATRTKRRPTTETNTGTDARTTSAADADGATPFDLDAFPDVARALAEVTVPADRSVDTMRVVAAVYDADLTLAHARWTVAQRPDLAERIESRHDDDVLACWHKIDTDRGRMTVDLDGDADDGNMPGQARFTDAGLAEIVAAQTLRRRFLRARGVGWLHWTGTHWHECGDGPPTEAVRKFVIGRIRFFARKLADNPGDLGLLQTIASWKSVGSRNRITSVLALAGNIVEVEADRLDADLDLLNTPSGIVDLCTGEVTPHDPARLMTRITSGAYVPGYRHPDVDKALTALPDAERGLLQRRVGQGITGHTTPDGVVLLLQGSGENGKSALTTGGLFPALGGYAHIASSRLFSADKNNDHSTERADLRGRRLVIGEELTEGHSLDVTALKRMMDTPYITARRLYQDNTTFPASHTLIVNTNHRPLITETDHGTWRRLQLVVFPHTFVKRPEDLKADTDRLGDPELKQRMIQGADGQHDALVTWAVEGAMAWYADPRNALLPTERVEADTLAWRAETDRILAYWTERLTPDPAGKILTTDMYPEFNRWLTDNGHHEWAQETFGRRFADHQETKQHGVVKKRTRNPRGLSRPHAANPELKGQAQVWVGVRFRRSEDEIRAHAARSDPFAAGQW